MKSVCVMWDLCGEIIVQLSNIFAPDPWNPHFVTTTTLEPDTSLCPVYAAYICDSGGNVITKFKPASLRRYSPRPVNPDGAPRTRERGPTKTQRLQPWCSDKLWGCYFRSVSTWKSIEHHPNMSHPPQSTVYFLFGCISSFRSIKCVAAKHVNELKKNWILYLCN